MEQLEGRILKALGGFYYVEAGEKVYECRARGLFRKQDTTPLVGDRVRIELTEEGKGYVVEILPRKNSLIRPPLANLDQLLFVCSVADPAPNLFVLDKLIALAEYKDIEPVVVATKTDLGESAEFAGTYRRAGIPVIEVCNQTGEGAEQVREALAGRLSAFCGNSGVGKSSLLNRVDPRLELPTGGISQKLGRGRHTTRHVELFHVQGGLVADTPGFSSVDLDRCETILKDQLQFCFREFAPYQDRCRFTGCSHTREKGCAVLEALERGEIAPSRHESYKALYESAKNIKEWKQKDQGEGGRP
ncbi:MAG: ribosome small subunit-dependent GTPase A [Oscillospiraceae bacterium]|nr:ribosome small subunit-dependent GTPase A [Oscillospiraceae bacterium]